MSDGLVFNDFAPLLEGYLLLVAGFEIIWLLSTSDCFPFLLFGIAKRDSPPVTSGSFRPDQARAVV